MVVPNVFLQETDIEEICRACGNVVNEFCCKYHQSCCECKRALGLV